MSTHPVLLGRVTGLNVGDTLDTPKREGQTSPPCHLDIEASQRPTVTRVTHGDSQSRPSWTWRCLQMSIALLVVIFTTWFAIDVGSWGSSDMVWMKDLSLISLMVSTGIAGLAAMWLYLIAPTAHTLFAARFLLLNWVEGLVTLSSIAAEVSDLDVHLRQYIYHAQLLGNLTLRWNLLLLEFVALQFLIQNRLQSLWPALNRPGCKVWLARCLWMEVAGLFLSFLVYWAPAGVARFVHVYFHFLEVASALFRYGGVPICFLIWIVLVTVTLFRVVLMFQKALDLARQQGLAVAATFQACRGRIILQCAGVIISLTTTLMAAVVVVGIYISLLQSNYQSYALSLMAVTQCINLFVNAAGVILLSGASSLITSQGTLRFPPLRCCRCPCRLRRCCGFKSCCRSNLQIGEENDWEKKTRELANRGISLEELLAFYKNLGDTVMQSFQPSVHTTTDVVRLAIIPLTASTCSSYAQLVNKGAKVLPKKMVTHNWSNLFRDLLASVISEALGEHTFEFVAELLSDKAGVEALEKMLRVHGSLQEMYWICAFAVNQHAGICGANPAGTVDPVTGLTHPTCQCSEPKFFNQDPPLNDDGKSIQCEMNKFDDMMALLARENPDFAEVVAVDASLDLFGRAWCVAELARSTSYGHGAKPEDA